MADDTQLESFIAASFRSVWALEVLRFLASVPDASFTPGELIERLRVSDAVISQSVASLAAAGLILTNDDGRIGFHPGSEERLAMVKAAIDLYDKSPDKVRRMIVGRSSPGITAFADAFRLRRD
jgi:DNA-binding transcriptional ArsR family regulator